MKIHPILGTTVLTVDNTRTMRRDVSHVLPARLATWSQFDPVQSEFGASRKRNVRATTNGGAILELMHDARALNQRRRCAVVPGKPPCGANLAPSKHFAYVACPREDLTMSCKSLRRCSRRLGASHSTRCSSCRPTWLSTIYHVCRAASKCCATRKDRTGCFSAQLASETQFV